MPKPIDGRGGKGYKGTNVNGNNAVPGGRRNAMAQVSRVIGVGTNVV